MVATRRGGRLWSLKCKLPLHELTKRVVYQSDSDWRDTRKATSCVFGYLEKRLFDGQVATEAVVPLSSGEAESHAMGRAAIMTRLVFEQLDASACAGVQSDSSPARGMPSRIGCSKIRHLQIRTCGSRKSPGLVISHRRRRKEKITRKVLRRSI